jgi:hypothetical protein
LLTRPKGRSSGTPSHNPIRPPKGKPLLMLNDAANYIMGITEAARLFEHAPSVEPTLKRVRHDRRQDQCK